MSAFHPDLAVGRLIPRVSLGPASARFIRSRTPRPIDPGPDLLVREINVPGPAGAPAVTLRVYQPVALTDAAPAVLWIHGGGLVIGSPEQDDRTSIAFARELGVTVAAVRYRLAPDARAPAAVEDAYAAYEALLVQADALKIDPDRIALAGASAGGGIAAALALLIHDRGGVQPVFQLLVYPMLDDRTVTRPDLDTRTVRVWTPESNRFGWSAYLGREPGGDGISPYAAPARRADLSGLPPAWIGVGTLDLFHDEDVEYARRLNASGVPCELYLVPGAFHGFDALFSKADVTVAFWNEQVKALQQVLCVPERMRDAEQ